MMARPMVRLAPCAALLVGASACGAPSRAPDAAAEGEGAGIAIARIDTRDPAVSAALRDRALEALPRCEALAPDRPRGHMDLSVEVDDAGQTVAGILHTTFRSDELSECLARALTGITLPDRGASSRVRVRFEGR